MEKTKEKGEKLDNSLAVRRPYFNNRLSTRASNGTDPSLNKGPTKSIWQEVTKRRKIPAKRYSLESLVDMGIEGIPMIRAFKYPWSMHA